MSDEVVLAEDVCRRAGISFRQLSYWRHLGYLGDERRDIGSGSKANYTENDVATLRIIRSLYHFRTPSVQALRAIVPTILERVRTGDLGTVRIAPALYLDLAELVAEKSEAS